jgi:hypothetical protein
MANNKKGIWKLSNNKSKHFFKNRLHDGYKSTAHTAHQFNAFFVENVDRLLKQNKFGHDTVSNKILNSNSMFLALISEDEVLKVTNKLKGKFSASYDEILEKLVKTFQNLMKIAKVWPIYKKGKKQEISNYSPISILPVFENS